MKKLTIGSRDSRLAMIQTHWVRDQLLAFYPDLEIEIKEVKTQGDKILDVALSKIGDKALFTKELENELLAGTIDLAVHSMKDLPTRLPEGLAICVTSCREDVRDVACFSNHAKARGVSKLAEAKVIATSSLRRIAQLKAKYPKAEFVDIRGNLQTRFKKLHDEANAIDAVILAAAGIHRLGEKELIDEYLDPAEILPAVGQGALAVEIDASRQDLAEFLRTPLNDEVTEKIVAAERSYLRTLEGGCQVPIGIYSNLDSVIARSDSDAAIPQMKLSVKAFVSNLDGSKKLEDSFTCPLEEAEDKAIELAKKFIEQGAKEILASS